MKTKEEFMAKVDRINKSTEECHLWTGAKDGNGYGSVNWMGRITPAHRIAYQLQIGTIPDGGRIQWSCTNKLCMNGTHLKVKPRSPMVRIPSRSMTRRLKTDREARKKVPLVVVDQQPRHLQLIQDLTAEANRLDEERREAILLCTKSESALDTVLLEISTFRTKLQALEQMVLEIFKDESYRKLAELGKELQKERK